MGRSVMVTGASRGIGLATALELAAAGYDVVGTVRSPDKAEQVERAASARGVQVRTVEMDVDDAGSCTEGVGRITSLTGGIWGLVNNAGYAQFGTVEDIGDDLVHRQLETNVVAPVSYTHLTLPTKRIV